MYPNCNQSTFFLHYYSFCFLLLIIFKAVQQRFFLFPSFSLRLHCNVLISIWKQWFRCIWGRKFFANFIYIRKQRFRCIWTARVWRVRKISRSGLKDTRNLKLSITSVCKKIWGFVLGIKKVRCDGFSQNHKKINSKSKVFRGFANVQLNIISIWKGKLKSSQLLPGS